MSFKEKKNIEKQIKENQKNIQEIREKSDKLDEKFYSIEKNIQPIYKMPNTNKKKTTKSISKSRKPSTEEQRKKWREAKQKQKANRVMKKEEKNNYDDFELFDINDDSLMSQTPPDTINYNPFQDEIIRYDNESEENLIRPFKDEPLSLQNTPTKPKKGGKTRKNKKR